MTAWYFVRPTDSLFVRGNLAFGDAGEHGAGVMPPPPSMFAGAFRSAILARDASQLAAFVQHDQATDPAVNASLGTPAMPGSFRVSWLSLAGVPKGPRAPDAVEALMALPSDLLWLGDKDGFAVLKPRQLPAMVASAGVLPLRAILQTPKQAKPEGGRYIGLAGLQRHLLGDATPDPCHAIASSSVHQRDPRLGISLNVDSQTAGDKLIYTTEGHAFTPPRTALRGERSFAETGFLVGLEGVLDLLPAQGHLRLGGDGRSAVYCSVSFERPRADLTKIASSRRFRLILQTPGLFGDSAWLPHGVAHAQGQHDYQLQGPGFSARLVCAAVGRREVVSGWDLHAWKPKAAEAAAPAGSVYWFDEFSGDTARLADWAMNGLRLEMNAQVTPRHAEGWNQALLGLWPLETSTRTN